MPGWRAGSQDARRRGLGRLALATCLIAATAAVPARAATSVSLTFDDGQATQYAVRSALASRDMHATFYVNSAKVGTSGFYMTWTQASTLAADGNEIGGHTLTHVDLSTLSDAQMRTEICTDRQNLIGRGFDPVSFAYPYGGGDAAAQVIAGECGYLSGRRVGGIVSPGWCPECGTPRAESVPPLNPYETRTPSFGSGEMTLGAMQGVITQAELSGGGWVQLVFHGVCATATCGEGWVTPTTFAALLDWLEPRAAHGTVVRTVREVIEPAPPETAIDSKPDAVTRERSASFTLSSNRADATFECSMDSGAWEPCTSPVSYSGLTVGGHSFSARARDALGATDPTPATWAWTVEPAPGAPTVVSLTFDDAQATQYAAKEPLKRYGMHGTFYANSAQVCTSSCDGEWNMSWTQLEALAADGHEIGGHTLEHVDLTSASIPLAEKRRQVCEDHANLTARGFDPVSFAYPYGHVDATAEGIVEECGYASGRSGGDAPAGGETIPPLDPFRTRTPGHSTGEITLGEMQTAITRAEAEGGGWVQLAFHGICATACGEGWVKPATFSALLDWLEPRAADGTVVRTVREVIGRTPPDTAIESGPDGTVASTSASFAFTATEAGSSFECRLDAGVWGECNSPNGYSRLAQGSHTFSVRALDSAGNVDASPAARTWTVDTVAPDTSIASGPIGTVAWSAAAFTFSSGDAAATFECRLDAGAWEDCVSPASYASLAGGTHAFSVRASDAAGNTDATPASRTWSVDTTAPGTAITDGPSGAVGSTATSFAFVSADAGATFECRLDDEAWSGCGSPKAYSGLADGPHTFSVRALDSVGHADPIPATRQWTVDTVAPETSIAAGPSGTVDAPEASFEISSSDADATFECRLDGATWEACSLPIEYAGLAEGVHTFAARAIDAAGNADQTPASRPWTVDTVAPETSIASGPSGTVTATAAGFGFSSPENGVTFECRLDGDGWAPCESPKSYAALSEGEHEFSVRASDAVGNLDPTPAVRRWMVAAPSPPPPVDPPPPPPAEEDPPPPVQEDPAPPVGQDALPPAQEVPADPPPADPSAPPATASGDPGPQTTDDWASSYLARVLEAAAQRNRGRRLKALLRRGALTIELPRTRSGSLRVTLSLLPDDAGAAVRLARARAAASSRSKQLGLRLGRGAKRRLARLWVAALELDATFVPEGGVPVHDRRVFLIRR